MGFLVCRNFLCVVFSVSESFPQDFSDDAEVKNPSASTGEAGSMSELGRSPGGGNGNPLQWFYLGSPMDGGA